MSFLRNSRVNPEAAPEEGGQSSAQQPRRQPPTLDGGKLPGGEGENGPGKGENGVAPAQRASASRDPDPAMAAVLAEMSRMMKGEAQREAKAQALKDRLEEVTAERDAARKEAEGAQAEAAALRAKVAELKEEAKRAAAGASGEREAREAAAAQLRAVQDENASLREAARGAVEEAKEARRECVEVKRRLADELAGRSAARARWEEDLSGVFAAVVEQGARGAAASLLKELAEQREEQRRQLDGLQGRLGQAQAARKRAQDELAEKMARVAEGARYIGVMLKVMEQAASSGGGPGTSNAAAEAMATGDFLTAVLSVVELPGVKEAALEAALGLVRALCRRSQLCGRTLRNNREALALVKRAADDRAPEETREVAREVLQLVEACDKDRVMLFLEEEFAKITGLEGLKATLKQFVNEVRLMELQRKKRPDTAGTARAPHMMFMGNPGVGKTSIARIIPKLYREIGLLKEDKLVEVQRQDLVGQYVGETAQKTKKVLEKARGGVLFLDEAYRLTEEAGSGSFGKEAFETIMGEMTADRADRVVFIFAGYKEQMDRFVAANDGMNRRIGCRLIFEDYTIEQLVEIFEKKCKAQGYELENDARQALPSLLSRSFPESVRKKFNAGLVEQLMEIARRCLSERLAASLEDANIDDRTLFLLKKVDLIQATATLKDNITLTALE